VCVATAALTLPLEAALLAALRSGDDLAAAHAWAGSLSDAGLQDAAAHIQDYPFYYRRAIMTALEPDDRALVWRQHLASYAATHALDAASRQLIARAIATMRPEVFDDGAPADAVAELTNAFEIATGLFGRRTAIDLFIRLGPDTSSFDALPVRERAAAAVRGWLGANARLADCDCSPATPESCDAAGYFGADACSTSFSCEPDVLWPMTGVVWSAPATGTCTLIHTSQR
jgi:hypothetical protein